MLQFVGDNAAPAFPNSLPGLEDITTTYEGNHGIGRVGDGRLKWEAHTEFLTLTFVVPASSEPGSNPPEAFQACYRQIEGKVARARRERHITDERAIVAVNDIVCVSVSRPPTHEALRKLVTGQLRLRREGKCKADERDQDEEGRAELAVSRCLHRANEELLRIWLKEVIKNTIRAFIGSLLGLSR